MLKRFQDHRSKVKVIAKPNALLRRRLYFDGVASRLTYSHLLTRDVVAMMSEDSDYTSDVNFPLQHQHNMSAHQYGADHDVIENDVSWHQHHQQQQPYYHGYYGNDQPRGRYMDGYHDERSGYGDYYNYEHSDERSSRQQGGYYDSSGYHRRQQRLRSERSDSESEPLSYNSRPQSYYTDRFDTH